MNRKSEKPCGRFIKTTKEINRKYRMGRTFPNIIIGLIFTVTVALASTTYFADKAELLTGDYWNWDSLISKYPDKVIQKSQDKLNNFGNWESDSNIRSEKFDEIANMLLAITKAQKAKKLPFNETLGKCYSLVLQFPNSPKTISVLQEIIVLDPNNKFDSVDKCLTDSKANIEFYSSFVNRCINKSDYVNLDRCIKYVVNKFNSLEDGLTLMAQFVSGIKYKQSGEFKKALERNVFIYPNSKICCAVFRQRALGYLKENKKDQLEQLATWIIDKKPNTELAKSAAAVLADKSYSDANYVDVVKRLDPNIFSNESADDFNDIQKIDNILTYYKSNTLCGQGIDLAKIYKALAEYHLSSCEEVPEKKVPGPIRYKMALLCYRKSAEHGGVNLEVFSNAVVNKIPFTNSPPETEVLFWQALYKAEEGDLLVASKIYEKFLEKDSQSVLAAKAYYDIARAKMTVGWLQEEAKEAIKKAKAISPCQPVTDLETKINSSASN